MYIIVILIVFAGLSTGYDQISKQWTCPKTPTGCLFMEPAIKEADECQLDVDCQVGAQCCYRGFTKKCEFPELCESVICKDGYICQSWETPCSNPPCHQEATCLPAIQVRCTSPVCTTEECQPGFERASGTDGCPTCECVHKKVCSAPCKIFCTHGYENGPDGCPLCKCIPEPDNLCSNMTCGPHEECRFIEVLCKRDPCKPVAMCVPIMKVLYENTCSLSDPTTIGLPVLDFTGTSELDCYLHPCPDNTVCSSLGQDIKRCCWQSTQEQVLSPPKPGECPLVRNSSSLTQKCQIDGTCPGEQKCCNRKTDPISYRAYGICENPMQRTVKMVPEKCQFFSLIRMFFNWFGVSRFDFPSRLIGN